MHISKHSKRLLHLSWVVILAGYLLDYLLGSSNPVDGEQTTFYNQIGSLVSYAGYALLLVAMILFFCAPHTHYRATIKSLRNELKPTYEKYRVKSKTVAALLLLLSLPAHAVYYGQASRQVNHYWRLGEQQYKDVNATSDLPTTVAPIVADAFGDLYVWNDDRVCPLSTVAENFCLCLYGRHSYRGMSPMQVMLGYTFYPNEWENTRLKPYSNSADSSMQQMLIQQAVSAGVYKIFPPLAEDGAWMDWSEQDADSTTEDSAYRSTVMHQIVAYIAAGKNADAYYSLTQLRLYQQRCSYAGDLPTERQFRAEQLLCRFNYVRVFAGLTMCVGLCFFLWFAILLSQPNRRRTPRALTLTISMLDVVLWFLLSGIIGLQTWVYERLPLANSTEVLPIYAWLCLTVALVLAVALRSGVLRGILTAAMTLLAGSLWMLSTATIQLPSWICMVSYICFALLLVINLYALVASFISSSPQNASLIIYHVSRLILTPAVFLLAFGVFRSVIMVLITMLVYAAPIHWHPTHQKTVSIRQLRGFHLYLVLAFAAVIIQFVC